MLFSLVVFALHGFDQAFLAHVARVVINVRADGKQDLLFAHRVKDVMVRLGFLFFVERVFAQIANFDIHGKRPFLISALAAHVETVMSLN